MLKHWIPLLPIWLTLPLLLHPLLLQLSLLPPVHLLLPSLQLLFLFLLSPPAIRTPGSGSKLNLKPQSAPLDHIWSSGLWLAIVKRMGDSPFAISAIHVILLDNQYDIFDLDTFLPLAVGPRPPLHMILGGFLFPPASPSNVQSKPNFTPALWGSSAAFDHPPSWAP